MPDGQQALFRVNAHVASSALDRDFDFIDCIIEVRRLVCVVSFAEPWIYNRLAQPGGSVNASRDAARDLHNHVARAARGLDDIASCDAITDLDVHITSACPGIHAEIGSAVR